MGPEGTPLALIIPARLPSTRLPHKLLQEVSGKTVLEWTWTRAVAALAPVLVSIATDSEEIAAVARGFGAHVVRTGPARCGSERVAAAAAQLEPRPAAVINLQGDEPLIDPQVIRSVARALDAPNAALVTCAAPLTSAAEWRDPSVVKVVARCDGHALFFSRRPIPGYAGAASDDTFERVRDRVWRHVGVYGYPFSLLQRFVAMPPTPLEAAESLEQLRALEGGIAIRLVHVAQAAPAVDTPADLARVRRLFAAGTQARDLEQGGYR